MQPSSIVKAQLREQLNFTVGDRISKCDFFQEKKKVHKTVQMLLLAEVIGEVQCSLTMALKLGLVHTGRGLVIVLWAEEPPGCPHEPPARPV